MFCRICKNENFVDIIDLGNQTLSGRFPSSKDEVIPSHPLKLVKCTNPDCELVQLSYDTNRDDLYKNFYGYMSGINTTMKNHLTSLVRYIESMVEIKENDNVLDIGCNDGTTLSLYKEKLHKFGVDPTPEQFRHLYPSSTSFFCDYFGKDFISKIQGHKFKVVTSIAMFYDLPDPVEFASCVRDVLTDDGIWVLEQSYLPSMLNTNSFDTICHEHLEYYGLKQIQYIMSKVGLNIINVSFNDINGGSFRITVSKQNKGYDISRILKNEEKLDFSTFKNNCERIKTNLISLLKSIKSNRRTICGYGASTKGNVILQYCGIDDSLIDCIAERNPFKYGKFTPSTLIPIKSEEEVRKMRPDYILVLPWHFKEEFLVREKEYLKAGGLLIFPLPNIIII